MIGYAKAQSAPCCFTYLMLTALNTRTAPLSRLHDRVIEPIENIMFFDLPSRILRCSEYEHFLLWLSSKKMKCFQKVEHAYFISLSLT